MRIAIQRQLLELLETVQEGTDYLPKAQGEEAALLSENCREAVHSIGKTLQDQLSGGVLLEYEEQLQSIDNALLSGQTAPQQWEEVGDRVYALRQRLADEPEVRCEVVFLPYKASMWDTLETVWKAAEADPRCDAYVIPIPYYEWQPDGRAGPMQYEGNQFPPEVTITPWQAYNLKSRRPDAILTYNPYDDNNMVTSVHPQFYNFKLKNYTDLLVYVPYFVGLRDVDKRFCCNGGVLHADKIFVQSEAVRDTYAKVCRELAASLGITDPKKLGDEKFVALGSAKLDKALQTRQEALSMPDSWRKKIYRADGSRRKVVFFNTSLDEILKRGEAALQDMQLLLEQFEACENVVLLWRPHPLSEATCLAMRPELHPRFRAIVDDFVNQDNGIYDDTADLHRAIALSDGYYGMWSSVAVFFLCTGKPVLQVKGNWIQQQQSWGLKTGDIQGERLYLVLEDDLLATVDRLDGVCTIQTPPESQNSQYWCIETVRSGDRLVLIPFEAQDILIWDTKMGTFSRSVLPSCTEAQSEGAKFVFGYPDGQWVYLFGYQYPGIVRLNLQTGLVQEIIKTQRLGLGKSGESGPKFIGGRHCLYKGSLYMGATRWNKQGKPEIVLACFALTGRKVTVLPLSKQVGSGVSDVCVVGGTIWMSFADSNQIVRYQLSSGVCTTLPLPITGAVRLYRYHDCIYVIPGNGEEPICRIDAKDNITTSEFGGGVVVSGVIEAEDASILVLFATNQIRKVDFTQLEPLVTTEDIGWLESGAFPTLAETVQKFMQRACQIKRPEAFVLRDGLAPQGFIEALEALSAFGRQQSEICRSAFCNADGTAGKKMYQHIRDCLLGDC